MNQTTNRVIEIWERVTRGEVQANQDKIFIFGDNLAEKGFGGQAKEMRGEANAVGVPTKKEPNNLPQSFFDDKELAANKRAIDRAFGRIPANKTIVLPKAGIGTGLARLEEKAPQTFAYLNEKFAAIGFDNRRGEKLASSANGVIIQGENDKTEGGEAKRLLDLDDIKTAELKLLSPTTDEVTALEINRERALADYADRLRLDYKDNRENLRDGFRNLSGALDKGERITVVCACRSGQICHADVVKMAIEKVNAHIKNIRESKTISAAATESRASDISQIQNVKTQFNPRTQRAINEILAASENDRLLANISQTDGRNRSEQASYLGKFSQFTRDIYERGGSVSEGNLLVPQENLNSPAPLAVTTREYAVKKLGEILLGDEAKAKGLAPTIVEYGEKISGLTGDNETRLKVFGWIYDRLEGKSEFAEQTASKETRFENALSEIKLLAEEMRSLEPTDKIEFVPLAGEETTEQQQQRESVFEYLDESRIAEEIYENAIYRTEGETIEEIESFDRDGGNRDDERGGNFEAASKIGAEKYERIDLGDNFPPLPEEFTPREGEKFLTATLPEIDRQLESGIEIKEVLKPFNQNVWQSQKDDALNQLETIYQKQQVTALENKLSATDVSAEEKEKLESELSLWQSATLTPTQAELRAMLADQNENGRAENKSEKRETTVSTLAGKANELSEATARQIAEINIFGAIVIEIETPAEFRLAEETAVKTFFQKTKIEIASRLEKLDEINRNEKLAADKSEAVALRKELNQIRELKPSFAFKLETAAEIVTGAPSPKTVEERNFVAFYVNHQLKQPETRLRFENERYRVYAARLESAATREAVIKTASEIRAENAAFGMNRKDFEKVEKAIQSRPLTNREMQFLFTETSPAHYTQAMTVARLSYAHAGASRRMMTESLLKGEISPSPEAQKLIESLESRLQRGKPTDAINATKHFFESIKSPNENLKYKNAFDHRGIYRLLPPQEKDFVYERAVRQKENLEYQVAYREQRLSQEKQIENTRPALSQAEKSFHLTSFFHQAQILGERFESGELKSKEINERDFRAAVILLNNHPGERVALVGDALKQSANIETQKVGEILEIFSKAEISEVDNKREIKITLPENRLVSTDAYRELLEKFYPNETRENDKYKFANFNEKVIEDARLRGQDAALATFGEELKQNVYAADTAPTAIFSVERSIGEDLAKIAAMQSEGRNARRENESLLAKYAARAEAKMRFQNSVVLLSATEQKSTVRAALSTEKNDGAKVAPVNSSDEFFRFVQKEITVSDFQKFAANEKLIGENLSGIKNQFAAISAKQIVLEENKFRAAETRATDKLQDIYANGRLSAENRLLTEAARAAFERDGGIQKPENKLIIESIGDAEKSEIRAESFERARVALEPELKDEAAEAYNRQALKLADAIEAAYGLSKQNAAPEKIAAAFIAADDEKKALDAYTESRTEKQETKPFSLRLYEAEIERAEKELRKQNFSAKILAGVQFSESELSVNLDQIFSPDERERMKTEASEIAKSRLEPKELDADQRKIPQEASRQALATFRQLEQAHNVFQLSGDSAKIIEAFSKLDREAATLNRLRQNYSKAENLLALREGVKTDLADLLSKNQNLSGVELAERTSEILRQNFDKIGLTDLRRDARGTEILSREISEKIEAIQSPAATVTKQNNSLKFQEGGALKTEIAALQNDRAEKQAFVLTR